MSIIVAVKDKKNNIVYLGCDSQISDLYNKTMLNSSLSQCKIFAPKYNPAILIGVAGNYSDKCILEGVDDLIEEKDIIDYNYINSYLRVKIFDILNKNGRTFNVDGQIKIETKIIITYKGKMFEMGVCGEVIEKDDYVCIGAGSMFADGYLESVKNNNNITAENKCREAIEIACSKSLYCGGEVIIKSSK